ncbi:hypothetical protein E2C01_016355 [Portunus trituberculatus]|uniref:Uncharacterized protein n=1 Tax=Portunus trituberculatus TaxID=210409 RepID=A0A5B7DNW7_PORTR|nr:hypothetical protein [Portunus trituberculatus]
MDMAWSWVWRCGRRRARPAPDSPTQGRGRRVTCHTTLVHLLVEHLQRQQHHYKVVSQIELPWEDHNTMFSRCSALSRPSIRLVPALSPFSMIRLELRATQLRPPRHLPP